MNTMSVVSTVLTILLLGFLYWRMVKREIPEPVGWLQALLPIAIGMLSMPMTIPVSMGYLKALSADPNTVKLSDMTFLQSVERSFILAGGLEEIAKFILILVILVILRKKVKNVYEYILIGAAVGMGFSFFEEFAYGGGEDATIVSTVGRLISVPAHMTFNMVMAEFLGRAKFSKLSGKGSVILNYVLALLVPIIISYEFSVLQTGSCRKKYALLFVKPLNGSALYRLFRQSAHTAERFCLLLVANQHNELIDQQGCIADQCSD